MPAAPPPTTTVLATVLGVTALLWGMVGVARPSFTKGEKALTILIEPHCQEGAHEGASMGAAGTAAVPEDDSSTLHKIVSSIGPKLRDLRLQRGLSLQQLGERADVSAAAIHKIEKSGMVPTITTLLKLAGALNRSISYFVDEETEQNGPAMLVRADERRIVYTSHLGIDLAGISGPYGRFFLAGAVATVEPGASSGDTPRARPGCARRFVVE